MEEISSYLLRQVADEYWLIKTNQIGEEYIYPKQLNESGAMFFRYLMEGLSTEEIAKRTAAQYEGVSQEEVKLDVDQFRKLLFGE